jgi:hypothetical protein
MQEGTLIDSTILLYRLPLRWRTRIRRWNPPSEFIDEQLKGPSKEWVHHHIFDEVDSGTTRIGDLVKYTLPFQPLGEPGLPARARPNFVPSSDFDKEPFLRPSAGVIGHAKVVLRFRAGAACCCASATRTAGGSGRILHLALLQSARRRRGDAHVSPFANMPP